MTASRASAALAAALLLLAACATPAPTPRGSALEPLGTRGALVPDDPDLVARDLAAAALGAPRVESEAYLARLEAMEAERREAGEPPTGLLPVATDLANATLDDPIAYRRATRLLLERDDLDKPLEHRLKASVEDDPIDLANRRLRDELVEDTAQVFNALIGPLVKSAVVGVRGAFRLLRAIVDIAVSRHMEDELDLRERQALAHWKRFLDLHPDSPEAAKIAERTQEAQARWNRTRRDHAVRSAQRALRNESYDSALVYALRAERYAPEDQDATELREEATLGLLRERAEQASSVQADATTAALDADPRTAELAAALLHPEGDPAGVARRILEEEPEGTLADEARFVIALVDRETPGGDEDDEWEEFEEIGEEDDELSNMARHAEAYFEDDGGNPYEAFRVARRNDRLHQASWIFFGPFAKGPKERNMPGFFEWMIDLPSMVQMVTTFPNRLLQYGWLKPWPFGSKPAIHARRYLQTQDEGEHVREVARWLEEWETKRGNHLAAYSVAQAGSERDADDLEELRADAAEQALEAARRQTRTDMRLTMLREVAQEFQGTEAGDEAGRQARDELQRATWQRIRITRQFLVENPEVAGPDGLGLKPELLDGETGNGELHPDGVVLAGGRVVEFNFYGESGRKSEDPVVRHQEISQERLSRVVALLDETAIENFAADPGDLLEPDADRDLFFERARLGVVDKPDRRPGAQSSYTFLGMRERYGLVRGRESILPFDLVFQGNLSDLSFGIFPRIRTPKATPDALLYR